ncbi:MAG: hypothetical protein MUF83_15140 [Acidimicrobiales bacterium]|nr:hypothetical protein [Acidimicrobiales bacterium]
MIDVSEPSPRPLRAPRRRRGTGLLAATAALSVLVGGACGDGSDSSDAAAEGTAAVGTTPPALDPAAERLAGRYAHFDVVAYDGDGMKTLIISYGFTDLDVVDGEVVATDSFCFSEHRSDQPISVQMSDAATQAIRPVPVAVTLTTEDGRAHISRPETPTGIGVDLEDPANDALPTDPNDPRLADDDGDGKPGVTARITVTPELGGEIYLARREIFAYEIDEQPDGSLTGVVKDRSEQLVVGASNPIFLTNAQWTQHPDLTKSPIILVPVERSWDCEQLRTARDELFPPTPVVDW